MKRGSEKHAPHSADDARKRASEGDSVNAGSLERSRENKLRQPKIARTVEGRRTTESQKKGADSAEKNLGSQN